MTIRLERQDAVAIVVMDRPEKKNAITWEMRAQLYEALEGLNEDNSVRAVVLAGGGGDFCSGMDVGEFGGRGVDERFARTIRLHRISRAIYRLKKPTIAAVRGVCMGAGWSYALCCDFIIAGENARFCQVFNRTALAPDAGAVWLLARHVGIMRAKELCYTGRMIGAREAVSLGLALKTANEDQVLEASLAMASELAKGPALALAMAKRQFDLAATLGFDDFLEAEFAMPALLQSTKDHEEGVAAFRDKRPAQFSGA